MVRAMESAWTDRDGVLRIDHTSYRNSRTLRGLQLRGLVAEYSHVVTDAGREWREAHTNPDRTKGTT